MVHVVTNNLKLCFPGIQITRKGVNTSMKLIRRIENPDVTLAVVTESDTHYIAGKVDDIDKNGCAAVFAYPKRFYQVVGEFHAGS